MDAWFATPMDPTATEMTSRTCLRPSSGTAALDPPFLVEQMGAEASNPAGADAGEVAYPPVRGRGGTPKPRGFLLTGARGPLDRQPHQGPSGYRRRPPQGLGGGSRAEPQRERSRRRAGHDSVLWADSNMAARQS